MKMKCSLSVLAIAVVLSAAGPAIAAEKTVTLAVDNMYCSACPHIVKQSLAKVAGVATAAVSYENLRQAMHDLLRHPRVPETAGQEDRHGHL